ncbi:MAG: TIGR03016 family PEP-CTERM system-associated outer membrane protein [Pseudomonadota bacterium]
MALTAPECPATRFLTKKQAAFCSRPVTALIVGWTLVVPAQYAHAENWRVTPTLTTRAITSDNINFSPNDPASDTLVEVNPGVSVRRVSPRINLTAAYTPRYFHYVDETFSSRVSHAFNVNGRFEVIDDLFFMDVRAVAGQQNTSVFNAVPTDNTLSPNQLSNTRTYSITPSFRGKVRLGEVATWSSSLSTVRTESTGNLGSVSSETFNGALEGLPAKLGWRVDVSSTSTESDRGSTKRERITGSLIYRPDVSFQLSVRYGFEKGNVFNSGRSPGDQGFQGTYGAGIVWTPTPRTSIRADIDNRPFANTSSLSATHRMARMSFSATHARTLTNRAQQLLQPSGVVDRFDSLSLLEPFASLTDPIQREQLMTAFLDSQGISRYIVGLSPILTDSVFLQTRSQISLSRVGARNTMSLSLFLTESDSGVGSPLAATGDDFSRASVIRQHGWNASYSHRIGSKSSLAFSYSSTQSNGRSTSLSGLSSNRDVLNATLSTALGARTNGSIGLRMTRATVISGDVDENAVIATLNTRFN